MKEEKIEINIDLLIKYSLSFEQYFILNCVYNNKHLLLQQWIIKFGVFDKEIFNQLIEKGYLLPITTQITFDVLQLTQKYYDDFKITQELEHQKYFEELRGLYPKRVKGRAALHTDLAKCKKKYQEIVTSEAKHKLIMKCLTLYINDLTKTGKLEFIQALPTYINQKSWEAYEDLVNDSDEKEETSYTTI